MHLVSKHRSQGVERAAARRLRERLDRAASRRKEAVQSFRCPVHGRAPAVVDGPAPLGFEVAACCPEFAERIRSVLKGPSR